MDSNRTETDKKEKTPLIRSVYDFVELFVIAICIVFVIFTFFVRLCRVNGPSMEKTLFDGEMLLISDLLYSPEQGDIVVFHQTGNSTSSYNELIVKRVIATEGQFVQIKEDGVYVSDDSIIDESDHLSEIEYAYLDGGKLLNHYGAFNKEPQPVPEGMLFVMGDNRNHSADSRDPHIGYVDTRRIVGKVLFRISPLDRIGTVN